MSDKKKETNCPICNKNFPFNDIEQHANRCIFLNCPDEDEHHKRKRSPSPNLNQPSNQKTSFGQKSPRIAYTVASKSTHHENSVINSSQNQPSPSATSKILEKPPDMSFVVPLAKKVQPKTFEEFLGQHKVLGKSTVLRSLLEKGEIPNMILWGPPGCGKTSLSGILREICSKNPTKLKFSTVCAAVCGVKEVQNLITISKNELKFGRKTVLFMDEIHAFNKKQQDTMLLSVEKGEIILVGATTENPSFSINSALLSRCRVVVMEKLDCDILLSILKRAALTYKIKIVDDITTASEDSSCITIQSSALQWLADISDGDARIALNNLQLILQHADKGKLLKVDDIKENLKKSHMLYDRQGEEHYNLISAMHKSIRGSDPNAALYWTTRMIVSGEDPRYIARRLVRAASEDIGNADPKALQLAVTTMEGCQLLGMPEADVLLAQCVIYLARAPKSREVDKALGRAKALILNHKGIQPAVPMHIRNAPTTLMKKLGYGKLQDGGDFVFMPPELKDVNFFD
ncbi:ATPase WRNIP1 [Leptinotarsa decemlineata]|uniref:ATPase WRNIP1 n=1 Tax=Leptinotarsa decemlineata TaxID=7539 RepID=UPI003D308482